MVAIPHRQTSGAYRDRTDDLRLAKPTWAYVSGLREGESACVTHGFKPRIGVGVVSL